MSKRNELLKLLERSYSPYSNVKVSSIVVTDNGEYPGVNIENSAHSPCNCAERSAIFSAISNGAKEIKEIHLISDRDGYLYPCGVCRQVMSEFLKPDSKIFVYSKDFEEFKTETMESIFPHLVTKDSF